MNILLIGPVYTESSWGRACRSYIKAIQTFTNNITVRNLYMGGGTIERSPELAQLEKNQFEQYDVLIQMCLPSLFTQDKRIPKNIGIFFSECEHARSSCIYPKASLMDLCLVPSKREAIHLIDNGVVAQNIGIPVDPDVYSKDYPVLDKNIKANPATYTFYTIADHSTRKNLASILYSYMSAFTSADNVSLVIKTNHNIDELISNTWKQVRSYPPDLVPRIQTITNRISDDEIYGLHQSCDCFINMSYGESWCIPALDAKLFGNKVIYTSKTGIEDFTNYEDMSIDSHKVRCKVIDPPLTNYYTSDDYWYEPNLDSAIKVMKAMVYSKESAPQIKAANLKKYSYEQTGKRIKACLELLKA